MWRRALVVGASIALLAGCGGSSRATGCVKIFFWPTATKAQEAAAKRHLERNEGVESVRFLSKEQAWATLRKKYPAFGKGPFPANPLGDSFLVDASRSDAAPLAASLRPRPAGVEVVRYTDKPC